MWVVFIYCEWVILLSTSTHTHRDTQTYSQGLPSLMLTKREAQLWVTPLLFLFFFFFFFFKFTFMYQHPEEQMMGDDRLEEERERVARREEEWVGQGIRERRKSRGEWAGCAGIAGHWVLWVGREGTLWTNILKRLPSAHTYCLSTYACLSPPCLFYLSELCFTPSILPSLLHLSSLLN